jgi:nucleoside-diphosphate-sugar epimerase
VSVALVTGATGLLGSHVVDRLLSDGWSVRALTRSPDAVAAALPPGVVVRHGDIMDEGSLQRATGGCHVVFHAAASIFARGGWDAYRVSNIEGTRNVIAAAGRAGARLLHVSSVSVYGSARYEMRKRGLRTDEETAQSPLSEKAFYARSKRESEQLVLGAHTEGRVWASVVRPDVIYGTRDRTFVPRMARLIEGFFVPLLNDGRSIMAIVHAANVAQGAVLAATSDLAGGRAYNLANDFDVSARRFFELAGDGLGKAPRFLPMPMWLARGALRVGKTMSRVLTGGRYTLVSNAALDFLSEDNPYTSDRARRELGWRPVVHHETGVPEAFRWWREKQKARR